MAAMTPDALLLERLPGRLRKFEEQFLAEFLNLCYTYS